jgi:hypothetical protein
MNFCFLRELGLALARFAYRNLKRRLVLALCCPVALEAGARPLSDFRPVRSGMRRERGC